MSPDQKRSYADSVREELLEIEVKRPCCKKALAAGLLITAEMGDKHISVVCKSTPIADYTAEEIRRRFGKAPERINASAYGHVKWVLEFFSPAARKLLAELESSDEAEWSVGACEGCRSAFLRGVFLSCGTLNDPEKSTHLEFVLANEQRATRFQAFLSDCGYPPRVVKRSGGIGLYFKDGASVEDLLAIMGAGGMSMNMMNLRIEREIRNQENRATNCVAKNIEKSVSACARQMEAIEKLTVTGMLAQLPESIRVTALLRAENPDASLEELRMLHEPPITKSGLNHRLQKILSEADKI